MLKGERVKAVVYVDSDLLGQLKIALAVDQLSMSAWFREQAKTYVQSKQGVSFSHLMDIRRL